VLRGGTGIDTFRFAAAGDSGAPGQWRDRIMDFSQAEGDLIDVSAIDANTGIAGAQDFSFIANAAFSAAGQLRAQVVAGNTFVYGNTDADFATSEFSIFLSGALTLTSGDFLL
jgi:Ca2+-binding RTX toxin-like protein